MSGAQASKLLGSLIVLGFAWGVGGLEAWVCAGLIVAAVWSEGGPPKERGMMSREWRAGRRGP